MKKLLCLALVCLMLSGCGNHAYYDSAIVTEITDKTVVIEFPDGNLFAFEGYGYEIGDFVHVKLDDNGTEIKTDDIIIDVSNPLFR